jgi:hypothetical protein
VTTSGAETNVPLLVVGVFAATFLVVGAIAYLILFRQAGSPSRRAEPSRPVEGGAVAGETPAGDVPPEPAPQFLLPLDEPQTEPPPATRWETVAVRAETADPQSSHEPAVPDTPRVAERLYRVLMFTTGIAGLLASALMFSAVDGLSFLPLVALLIGGFSVYSIYRGFVPDAEFRKPRQR